MAGSTWQYDTGDMFIKSNASTQRVCGCVNEGSGSIRLDVEGGITLGASITVGQDVIMNAGQLVDGVDVVAFKAAYDAHIGNASAHHAMVTAGTGISVVGQVVSVIGGGACSCYASSDCRSGVEWRRRAQ